MALISGKLKSAGALASPEATGPLLLDISLCYYSCWICNQPAKAPVLNICGHIFCWACVPKNNCPACKAHLNARTAAESTVIPVYGGPVPVRKRNHLQEYLDSFEEDEGVFGNMVGEGVEVDKKGDMRDEDKAKELEEGSTCVPLHPASEIERKIPNPAALIYDTISKFRSEALVFRVKLEGVCRRIATEDREFTSNFIEDTAKFLDSQMRILIEKIEKDKRKLFGSEELSGDKKHLEESLGEEDLGQLAVKENEPLLSLQYEKLKKADHESDPEKSKRGIKARMQLESRQLLPNDNSVPSHGYLCGICNLTAFEPVVTDCGHLFCWRCLYLNVSTKKFFNGSCPICNSLVYVTPSRSSVNPIYSLPDGLLEDDILFNIRKMVFKDDKIHVPFRPPSFYASRFMEVLDTTMKECASMLEMKMEKLRQEWADSNPNAVEVLSREMQDFIDDTFKGLVEKWRERVKEYCNEYELLPSFFDATYLSCMPRKTEWMERWIEHTINGHTYSSSWYRKAL